jgi:hypothetical protein
MPIFFPDFVSREETGEWAFAERKALCDWGQARTARGIHGLPKVSPGPAMPNSFKPCGRATPETALQPFLGWPSSSPCDTSRRMGLTGDGNVRNE